ncbi:MAG: SPFH domain-containing protein, partial [Vicinamibacterales bacterium]
MLVVLLIVTLSSTTFQIKPEEVGLVLRFGRHVRTTEPGLHFKLPFTERVLRVPVQRQLKEEFGFRTALAGIATRYVTADFTGESVMLTGDLNVAVVEWVVQY